MQNQVELVRTALTGVLLAALLGGVSSCGDDRASAPATAFIHGRLFDGTGAPVIENAGLVVRGNVIEAVGELDALVIPSNCSVVDASGHTLLPGIINAHVHDSTANGNLERWARAGVTTVRDAHAIPANEAAVLSDESTRSAASARLVASGSMLTVEGGYPAVPWKQGAINVDGPEDARQKTEQLLGRGADFVKIAVESGTIMGQMPGVLAPPWPTLDDEEIASIVATAHAKGVRVAAHVTFSGDLARVVQAGVDDVMHMVVDPVDDQLIQQMVAKGIRWTPTLELWKGYVDMAGAGLLAGVEDNLRRFSQAGGRVVLGTDFAGADVPFEDEMPITELSLMIDAGMTPAQVLVAATGAAAEACDAKGAFGTLTPGAAADLLVVPGNALEDLTALTRPLWVLRGGVRLAAD